MPNVSLTRVMHKKRKIRALAHIFTYKCDPERVALLGFLPVLNHMDRQNAKEVE
jgi:hypothetical protein